MTHNIPKIEKRKLITSGNSIVLTVPKDWIEENKLKAGDEVLMVSNGDLTFTKIEEHKIEELRKKLLNSVEKCD